MLCWPACMKPYAALRTGCLRQAETSTALCSHHSALEGRAALALPCCSRKAVIQGCWHLALPGRCLSLAGDLSVTWQMADSHAVDNGIIFRHTQPFYHMSASVACTHVPGCCRKFGHQASYHAPRVYPCQYLAFLHLAMPCFPPALACPYLPAFTCLRLPACPALPLL